MSVYTIPVLRTPRQRLRALEADPNLRHSAARWLAHERVYPGKGALDVAEGYAVTDRAAVTEVEAAVREFREKAPGAEETTYLEWVLSELRAGVDALTEPEQLELAA